MFSRDSNPTDGRLDLNLGSPHRRDGEENDTKGDQADLDPSKLVLPPDFPNASGDQREARDTE